MENTAELIQQSQANGAAGRPRGGNLKEMVSNTATLVRAGTESDPAAEDLVLPQI